MRSFRLFIVLLALAAATSAAQDGQRGSTPPGQSQDGAAPSDGALKGGTILPGEAGGMPEGSKQHLRCEELTGTLRDECLKQARDAASGATGGRQPAEAIPPSPPVTTPPQNPR